MFRDPPPSLTLPLKGGGDRIALFFPSPLEGEGRVGGNRCRAQHGDRLT